MFACYTSFLLFANDLPAVITPSNKLLFADDLKYIVSFPLKRMMSYTMKTNYLKFEFNIDDTSQVQIDSITDLGVALQSSLFFDMHSDPILVKLSGTSGLY